MNEFGSLSTLLDELAPVVAVEEPGWDDVLARAEALTEEQRRWSPQAWSARRRILTAGLAIAVATVVAASALAAVGVNPLTALLNEWHSPGSPGPLDGAYSATLSGVTPASLDGRWTLTFASHPTDVGGGLRGSYVLARSGTVMDEGTYVFGGNQHANLVLTDTGGAAQCQDTPVGGFYQLTYNRLALKLQARFDRCATRRAVLRANLFTR